MSDSSEPVVKTVDLTKRYGEFLALDRLSIQVGRGQILGFIGPNGAGKTTAIKILVGLARPTSGSATIAGIPCGEGGKKIKRMVGYMPDRFGSYDNMRVREYLDFFAAVYGMNFENMPELKHPQGYFYALGAMAAVALGMLGYFRWKRWI